MKNIKKHCSLQGIDRRDVVYRPYEGKAFHQLFNTKSASNTYWLQQIN